MEDMLQRIAGYGRNMAALPFAGPPSFFRTNLVEDWSTVDIALIGVPTDAGLSHRTGARFGPQAMRAQSGLIRYINTYTKMIPYDHARVGDIGDAPIENTLDLHMLLDEIHQFYRRIRDAGVVPLSVGGDHSISYPILKALGARQPVALIHFDSHHDTTAAMKGTKFHHGAPFRNAVEDGVIDPARTVQIGIRDPYTEFAAPFARDHGFTVIEMRDIEDRGIAEAIARVREVVGSHPAYLSFDIDVLDPAFAPGTGTPVVGGLSAREAMRFLQGLGGLNIIGGDVVELSPPYDPTGMTALTGAQILFEMLCLTAQAHAKR
jgi:guanidinopropionase